MRSIVTGSLAAALVAVASATLAQDRVVNVYNWSDYIDDEVLAQFTEETGIRVVYDNYDDNTILETKLLTGDSGYDIAVPTDSTMSRLILSGALQKLDKSKIPNLANQWPLIAERLSSYDPGNEYATNYMWGTTGLGINVDMVTERLGEDADLDTWDLLFDPEVAAKLADCGIHMLDSAEDVIQTTLNYIGLEPDSKNPDEIQQAGEVLRAIRPYIQKFHSSEYINALANGDICVAMGYSGDILQARDRAEEAGNNVEVAYIIPREGALMWFDSFVIPADAPHVDEAHEFIDFMLRPEVAAANTNYVYYANGNIASKDLIDAEVLEDTSIYPDDETLDRLFTSTTYEQRVQTVITRLWTSVKAGT